jgi:hypothetical protein
MTYSKTLKAWRGTLTYEDLNTYLYGPTLTTPGALMRAPTKSIKDMQRLRRSLILSSGTVCP